MQRLHNLAGSQAKKQENLRFSYVMEFNIVYRQNLHTCMGKHLFAVIVAVARVVFKARGWLSNRSFPDGEGRKSFPGNGEGDCNCEGETHLQLGASIRSWLAASNQVFPWNSVSIGICLGLFARLLRKFMLIKSSKILVKPQMVLSTPFQVYIL